MQQPVFGHEPRVLRVATVDPAAIALDPRGNEGMRSLCLDPASGASSIPPLEPAAPDLRTTLPDDDLRKRAAEAASAS